MSGPLSYSKNRVQPGMRYQEGEVEQIIAQLFHEFEPLHKKIVWRRNHFHNDSSVDPRIGDPEDKDNPFRGAQVYQSTVPRQVADQLIPRLCENRFKASVTPPRETATLTGNAQDLEVVLNNGMQDVEVRNGYRFQAALAMGQVRDCYGVLHWYPNTDSWDIAPEYEWAETLPRDAGEAKRFMDMGQWCPECMGAGTIDDGAGQGNADSAELITSGTTGEPKPCPTCSGAGMTVPKEGRYRETPDAFIERVREERARAGFPWCIDAIDPLNVAFRKGRSHAIGFARVAVRMEMSRLDYEDAFQETRGDELPDDDELEEAPGLQYSMGQGTATHDTPSSSQHMDRVVVYQLWTAPFRRGFKERKERPAEFYEAVGEKGGFTLRKAFTRPGARRVPFALAPAIEKFHPDPVWRYEPYLESVFVLKPVMDAWETFSLAIHQMEALPLVYRVPSGKNPALMTDGRGNGPDGAPNSDRSGQMPVGDTLQQLQTNGSPASMKGYELVLNEYKEAVPPTGQAELDSGTKPWTARIAIQQANVSPGMLLANIASCLQECAQDIAYTHSIEDVEEGGFGEPLSMWGRTKGGKVDRSKVLTIEPKQIESLDIDVDIPATSASERIANTEHMADMFERGHILERDLVEAMGKENPDDYIVELRVEQSVRPYEAAFIAQQLAATLGSTFMVGVNGEYIAPGGQQVDPMSMLQAKGVLPPPPPPMAGPGGQGPANGGGPGTPNVTRQGPLPALSAPGAPSLPGVSR